MLTSDLFAQAMVQQPTLSPMTKDCASQVMPLNPLVDQRRPNVDFWISKLSRASAIFLPHNLGAIRLQSPFTSLVSMSHTFSFLRSYFPETFSITLLHCRWLRLVQLPAWARERELCFRTLPSILGPAWIPETTVMIHNVEEPLTLKRTTLKPNQNNFRAPSSFSLPCPFTQSPLQSFLPSLTHGPTHTFKWLLLTYNIKY